jgi:hypothetical protein
MRYLDEQGMNGIVFFRTNLFPVVSKGSFGGDRISNPGIGSVRPSRILVSEGIAELTHRGEIIEYSKDIQKEDGTRVITRGSPDGILRSDQASYESPVKESGDKLAFGVIAL